MSAPQYKIIFVGDGKVGKTSYVHRLYNNADTRYVPTIGVEVHPYKIDHDEVIFNIWDTAGLEKFGGLKDGYYIQGKCFIAFCSLNDKDSIINLPNWIHEVQRVCENVPFVLVLNKNSSNEENLVFWRNVKEMYPNVEAYEIDIKRDSIDTIIEPLRELRSILMNN